MVSNINCIEIQVPQSGNFDREIKLVAEVKAVFGFIIKVLFGRPIDTNYSIYNNSEELILCSQTVSTNNVLSDNMFQLTKMTNNIAGIDIGIAKKGNKYYLYCNEQCTLYCYIIQGSYPILVPLDIPITEGYEIVQSLSEGKFNKVNNNFRNIPKGEISVLARNPYMNISDDNLKCDWQHIGLFIKYDRGFVKIPVNITSKSIIILLDNEGYTSQVLVSFRDFVYNNVRYFRCYAKALFSNNENVDVPNIFIDKANSCLYIDSNRARTTILNNNVEFIHVTDIDTSNLEKLEVSTNIISDTSLSPIENHTIGFDKDTNNIFASYNNTWHNLYVPVINAGNKIYKYTIKETEKFYINIQSVDSSNLIDDVIIKGYYSKSGNSIDIYDNRTNTRNNISVFIKEGTIYINIVSSVHYISRFWSNMNNNAKLEQIDNIPDTATKLSISYSIVENYSDYKGSSNFIYYAKDIDAYVYTTVDEYYNIIYHYLNGDIVGKLSGSFSNKPKNVKVGYQYFCTDRQTSEGTSNGIVIYHKGNNVWVDSLGRTIE